jgi:hypothetical protein
VRNLGDELDIQLTKPVATTEQNQGAHNREQ